jgi:hypothetical protein
VEKGGSKVYIIERNGKTPENGKESSHSARGNGMNKMNEFNKFIALEL